MLTRKRTLTHLRACILAALLYVAGMQVAAHASQTAEQDSIAAIADRLGRFCKHIPQEQVFVHMDNTCYYLGDTIYYKAYVVRADSLTATDISGVLYVELLNQDGYLQERQTLRLTDGQAHGSFCLPDTSYAGFYELRAYTRWQLNWGAHEHPHCPNAHKWFLSKSMAEDFFRDYDKLYSRVFPVYDKPSTPGNYLQEVTPRPLRRHYPKSHQEEKAILHFYPEGGTWVAGAAQEIAFEASSHGRHLLGQVAVLDEKGDTIAEATTENRGRGTITLLGHHGSAYKCTFKDNDGHTATAKMPDVKEQGVILSVLEKPDKLAIKIHRERMGDSVLAMSILLSGRLVYNKEIGKDTLEISTKHFPPGIAQLTIYDTQRRIWADRLVFVHPHKIETSQVTLSLPDTMARMQPYARMELKLSGHKSGRVSVSVQDRDTSPTTQDNGCIVTEMLLSSQIRGFVENPRYYFQEKDSTRKRHLDLLLRVQGWRRYNWVDMTHDLHMREPFEPSPILCGDMSRYTPLDQEDYFCPRPTDDLDEQRAKMRTGGNGGPKLEDMLALTGSGSHALLNDGKENSTNGFYSSLRSDPADHQFLSKLKKDGMVRAELAVVTNSDNRLAQKVVRTRDGHFCMQIPHSDSPYFLYLVGADLGERRELMLDGDEYPKYSVRTRPFFPRYAKPYEYYQVTLDSTGSTGLRDGGDSNVTNLSEVTVKARRKGLGKVLLDKPVMTLDAYEAFNQTVDAGLSPAWYAGALSFTLNLARLYIGDMGIKVSYDIERRWNGRTGSSNIPQSDFLRYNHLRNLHKVRIYTDYAPRLEGDPRYESPNQPPVTISLECLSDNMQRTTYRDRRYLMTGYNVCEEFYQPHYESLPPPEHKDFRRTLYWNPDLQLDQDGHATIIFYGNSQETSPTVTVEGIADDGTLLSGRSELP